jgi:hypothetical protein
VVTVPKVVILFVPAQVLKAVFSTLPRPTSDFVKVPQNIDVALDFNTLLLDPGPYEVPLLSVGAFKIFVYNVVVNRESVARKLPETTVSFN